MTTTCRLDSPARWHLQWPRPPLVFSADDLTRRVRSSSGRGRSQLGPSFPNSLSIGQSFLLAPSSLSHPTLPSRKVSQRLRYLCACPSSIPQRFRSASLPAFPGSTPFSRPFPCIDLQLSRPVQVSS